MAKGFRSKKAYIEHLEREEKKRARRLKKEMKLQELIQGESSAAFDRGAKAGFEKGVREATTAVRMSAFADLSNAWGQLEFAHKAASEYAKVVARMYFSQTNVKKEEKGADQPAG